MITQRPNCVLPPVIPARGIAEVAADLRYVSAEIGDCEAELNSQRMAQAAEDLGLAPTPAGTVDPAEVRARLLELGEEQAELEREVRGLLLLQDAGLFDATSVSVAR